MSQNTALTRITKDGRCRRHKLSPMAMRAMVAVVTAPMLTNGMQGVQLRHKMLITCTEAAIATELLLNKISRYLLSLPTSNCQPCVIRRL